MLRLLIENGACPFATTISKSETAAQIFDESSDYAAGAEYMALVEECMGEVNEGKVSGKNDKKFLKPLGLRRLFL